MCLWLTPTCHSNTCPCFCADQVSSFIINTVNAGSGSLAVTVEGPSKVKLECQEVDEGYRFTYRPKAPGDYLISIKYDSIHIAGSPFKARIGGMEFLVTEVVLADWLLSGSLLL